MKRVLCVWFPNWPLQRLLHVQPELKETAVILYRSTQRGLRVISCSRRAAKQGVSSGMPVAEARGLFQSDQANSTESAPCFVAEDRTADDQALLRLAQRCHIFSPLVGLDTIEPAESLLLDVTGCAHLFHGEAGLITTIQKTLHRWRLRGYFGLADTPGAAWAAAHFVRHAPDSSKHVPASWILPPGQQVTALRSLPLTALRLPPPTWQTLTELDIRTLGQFAALPRASLPARFGKDLLLQWQRLSGELAEPLVPVHVTPQAVATREFEYPLRHREAVTLILHQLLEHLVQQLQTRQLGIQRLRLSFQGEPNNFECSIGFLRPSTCGDYLSKMVATHLEQQRLPAELHRITVQATATARLTVQQDNLFVDSATRERQGQFERFLEQLSSRLGPAAVLAAEEYPDAQPEYAYRYHSWVKEPQGRSSQGRSSQGRSSQGRSSQGRSSQGRSSQGRSSQGQLTIAHHEWVAPTSTPFFAARPLWLFDPPQPVTLLAAVTEDPPVRFRWRGRELVVQRHWGPERIVTGWWRDAMTERDYYRIETSQGERLWLFRCGTTHRWFMHGTYA